VSREWSFFCPTLTDSSPPVRSHPRTSANFVRGDLTQRRVPPKGFEILPRRWVEHTFA
jgi:hypothetical protein